MHHVGPNARKPIDFVPDWLFSESFAHELEKVKKFCRICPKFVFTCCHGILYANSNGQRSTSYLSPQTNATERDGSESRSGVVGFTLLLQWHWLPPQGH